MPDGPNADGGGQSALVEAATPAPRFVPVHNPEAVIRSQIHPGAKQCYRHGLESDPTQAGKIVILIKIAPSGEVDTVTVQSNGGLSATVAACISSVALGAKFEAPGPSGSQISVPFNFQRLLPDGGLLSSPPARTI